MTKLTTSQRLDNIESEIKLLNKSRKTTVDNIKDIEECIKNIVEDINKETKKIEKSHNGLWNNLKLLKDRFYTMAEGEAELWEKQIERTKEHEVNLEGLLTLVKKIRQDLRSSRIITEGYEESKEDIIENMKEDYNEIIGEENEMERNNE